eukprot:627568-Amphidinium_carterae.1
MVSKSLGAPADFCDAAYLSQRNVEVIYHRPLASPSPQSQYDRLTPHHSLGLVAALSCNQLCVCHSFASLGRQSSVKSPMLLVVIKMLCLIATPGALKTFVLCREAAFPPRCY